MSSLHDELGTIGPLGPTAVTVGVFDGVHRGHVHVIDRLRRSADTRGLTVVVLTFANHPLTVLRPETPLVLLSPFSERLALLRACGVEHVTAITFTRELSHWSAEQFVTALKTALDMRHLVIGPDFALGHGREGTIPVLTGLGERLGFTVEAVEPLLLDGTAVNSTAIREALGAGDLEWAARCLGRPFSLSAPVERGEGRGGATLGFPTANLALDDAQALPADGIYAAWLDADGVRHASAASVGTKPTFHEHGDRTVEAFVLDFEGDLYGKQVRLEFVRRLRGQERFEDAEALAARIRRDVEETRAVLEPLGLSDHSIPTQR